MLIYINFYLILELSFVLFIIKIPTLFIIYIFNNIIKYKMFIKYYIKILIYYKYTIYVIIF